MRRYIATTGAIAAALILGVTGTGAAVASSETSGAVNPRWGVNYNGWNVTIVNDTSERLYQDRTSVDQSKKIWFAPENIYSGTENRESRGKDSGFGPNDIKLLYTSYSMPDDGYRSIEISSVLPLAGAPKTTAKCGVRQQGWGDLQERGCEILNPKDPKTGYLLSSTEPISVRFID